MPAPETGAIRCQYLKQVQSGVSTCNRCNQVPAPVTVGLNQVPEPKIGANQVLVPETGAIRLQHLFQVPAPDSHLFQVLASKIGANQVSPPKIGAIR